MCLIIASQDGKLPDWEYVSQGYKDNPHSWGIMSSNGKRISIYRGLDKASFERAYSKLGGDPYVIHFRWATHGKIDIANCHPFEVAPGLMMAHNGVIKIEQHRKDKSDTWHYAKHLRQLGLTRDNFTVSENLLSIGIDIGPHNRVAFLSRNGDLRIVNESSGTDVGSVWFSNDYSFPQYRGRWKSLLCSDHPESLGSYSFGACDSCQLADELLEYDDTTHLCESCYEWWKYEEYMDRKLARLKA